MSEFPELPFRALQASTPPRDTFATIDKSQVMVEKKGILHCVGHESSFLKTSLADYLSTEQYFR